MHFDDRISTVLRQRVGSAAVARIQFRQLIDLLGTLPSEFQHPSVDAAMDRLADLATDIPLADRAAILRERGLRLRNPRLVALLSGSEPAVAQATINAAQLNDEQWLDLAPALPPQARAAIGARRDLPAGLAIRLKRLGIMQRSLPPAVQATPTLTEPMLADADSRPEGIRAIVQRIEEYTRSRRIIEAEFSTPAAPRLPLGQEDENENAASLQTFDFLTDGEARISWAAAHVAPMVVGLRLSASDVAATVHTDAKVQHAMRLRLPIESGSLSIDGAPAIAGEWKIDAMPCFDPVGGRFTGYRGRMRRPSQRTATHTHQSIGASQGDHIRQLLHELRTPVNAIQGFGEVIQQQLFGPTPHEYRALASSIVGDAARILAGFEELERLAKLETDAQELEPGSCDLAALAVATTDQLNAHMLPRESRFVWKSGRQLDQVAMQPADAERLLWRLLAALASQAAPGEIMRIAPQMRGDKVRIKMELPQALAKLDDRELFAAVTGANPQVISASMFGTGFALRLAATEARAAGGSIDRRKERLVLTLPGLTGTARDSSPDGQLPAAG